MHFRFMFLLLGSLNAIALGGIGAAASISEERDNNAYYFVSHYEIRIDAAPAEIWPHLIDLGSWMYEFEVAPVSGNYGEAGYVVQLYPDQPFYVQITRAIPNRLLTIANLPSTIRGETSTGVGVITLSESAGGTTVNLTMSRRYEVLSDEGAELKAARASNEFRQNDAAMWKDRFLTRLKERSESATK